MARYRRQEELFEGPRDGNKHGGEYAKGKRKIASPLATKRSMHVVLKSERARGKFSLNRPATYRFIHDLIEKLSKECFVKAYEIGIEENHIHLLARAKTRR